MTDIFKGHETKNDLDWQKLYSVHLQNKIYFILAYQQLILCNCYFFHTTKGEVHHTSGFIKLYLRNALNN